MSLPVILQLFGICLIALSLRDDASRRSLFLRSNLASSAISATAATPAIMSSSGNATYSTPIISKVRQRGRRFGGETFATPGKNRRWKFKRFDLSAWKAAPKVEMGTDDAADYFR